MAQTYHYLAPSALPVGTRVQVPFGKRSVRGVVVGLGDKNDCPPHKLKPLTVLNEPALSHGMVQFIVRAADYVCASAGEVLALVDRGVMPPLKRPRAAVLKPAATDATMALNPEQAAAATQIVGSFGQYATFLLDGVTGSGKTAVYLEVCAQAMQRGQQVLVLLPEIALTMQMADRFEQRFGVRPPCWSSEATPAQKRTMREGLQNGTLNVLIGARSALFLPMHNPAAIIIDEEHDNSYKQDEGLRYQGRDMAVLRAHCEKFVTVLGSATPALETHINAQQQRYTRLTLTKRYGEAALPTLHVVDMREQPRGALSVPLREAMQHTHAQRQMSLLYVNRRGYAPLMLCKRCGAREQCASCDVPMSLHQYGQRLQCHACGHTRSVPKRCETCGGQDSFTACGYGVERLAEEVHALWPDWRIKVLSSDCKESPTALAELLNEVKQGHVDVLIGTQMVAKGHDFAQLTCVGVVDADLGLAGADPRAAENTFQLIEQVAGRAGRGTMAGQVYIQTHDPQHAVIVALLNRDRDGFLAAQANMRRIAGYPPFGGLAAVIASSENEPALRTWAQQAAQALPVMADMSVYGPTPALFYKVRNRYRVRFLFKTPRRTAFASYFQQWQAAIKVPAHIRLSIDIDPYTFV